MGAALIDGHADALRLTAQYTIVTVIIGMEGLGGEVAELAMHNQGPLRFRQLDIACSQAGAKGSTASVAGPHQGGGVRTDILAPGILLDGNGAITPVGTLKLEQRIANGDPAHLQGHFGVTIVAAVFACRGVVVAAGLQFEFQRMIRM